MDDERLRAAVQLAWEGLRQWEATHEAAGGVPYTPETRQRAACHLTCVELGLPVPEGLRGFPPVIEAAVREGTPWPS